MITLILLTSCEEDKVIPLEEYIILNTKSVSVPQNGSEFNVSFKAISNVTFTIDENSQWILPESELKSTNPYNQNSFKFGVQSSCTEGVRTGYIYLHCEQDTDTVTVTQAMKEYLTLEQKEITVDSKGETFTVRLSTNTTFSFKIDEGSDWIKSTDSQIDDNPETHTKELVFNAEQGDVESSREGYIYFMHGVAKDTLFVFQDQRDELILSEDRIVTDAIGGTFSILLGHNTGYTITIPQEVDWINIPATQSGAYTNEEIVIEISKNTSSESRECTLTFTSSDGNLSDHIEIYQSGISPHYADFMALDTPGWYRYTTGEEFVIEYRKYTSQYAYVNNNGKIGFRIVSGENYMLIEGLDEEIVTGNIYSISSVQNYISSFSRSSVDNYQVEKVDADQGTIWLFDHRNEQGMIIKNK